MEKFLETPVKRYSSGMYVRLAFAVAAHLEPEILVVDEVLAVGDVEFQKKCLGKMGEVARGGRTVLFVSHNMNAVQQLCTKAVLLDAGNVRQVSDDVEATTTDYLFGNGKTMLRATEWVNTGGNYDNPYFKPFRFAICDEHGKTVCSPISNNRSVWVQLEGHVEQLDPALQLGYALYTESGQHLYSSYQIDVAEAHWPQLHLGRAYCGVACPAASLNEGTYRLEMIGCLYYRGWLFQPGVNAPSVVLTIQGGLSDSPYWMRPRSGILAPVFEWDYD